VCVRGLKAGISYLISNDRHVKMKGCNGFRILETRELKLFYLSVCNITKSKDRFLPY